MTEIQDLMDPEINFWEIEFLIPTSKVASEITQMYGYVKMWKLADRVTQIRSRQSGNR